MKAYNIGDCIRQLREEQNVNQEDFVPMAFAASPPLSRIERGCHVPSMGTVALLLQRLGVNEIPFLSAWNTELEISNLHRRSRRSNAQKKVDEALQKNREDGRS